MNRHLLSIAFAAATITATAAASSPRVAPTDASPRQHTTFRPAATAGVKFNASATGWQTLYDNPFACLTAGTEEAPVEIDRDIDGNIPMELIGTVNYGFGGKAGIAQAGGSLYVPCRNKRNQFVEIWTPSFPYGAYMRISFDVKIAPGSSTTADAVTVVMASQQHEATVTTEWSHVEYTFDASVQPEDGDDYMIRAWVTEDADLLIKDMRIERQETPSIAAPTVLPHTEYTGSSFVANWEAVSGATGYLLTVGEYNIASDAVGRLLLDAQPVTDTSHKVEGIEQGRLYMYRVQATTAESVSIPSAWMGVRELLCPTDVTATLDEVAGVMNVKWTAPIGANAYYVDAYAHRPLKGGSAYDFANADFSWISSTGTFARPAEDPEYFTKEVPGMAGWYATLPGTVDGGFGIIDNSMYMLYYGYMAQIVSPEYDLTIFKDNTINVEVEVAAAGTVKTGMLVALYSYNESTGMWDISDNDLYSTPGDVPNGEYTKYTFALSEANKSCYLKFVTNPEIINGAYGDGAIMFRSIKAWGEPIADAEMPVFFTQEAVVDKTTATIALPTGKASRYSATVTAYMIDSDYNIWAQSPATSPAVTGSTGIDTIEAGSDTCNGDIRYYDLRGIETARPVSGNIYIRIDGGKATKVLVK